MQGYELGVRIPMMYHIAVTLRKVDNDAGIWYAGSGFLACGSPAAARVLFPTRMVQPNFQL